MTHLDATRGLLGNLTNQIEEMRKFVRLQRAELHQLNQAVLRRNRTIANLRLDRSTKDVEIRRLAAKVAYLVEHPERHPNGDGWTYPSPPPAVAVGDTITVMAPGGVTLPGTIKALGNTHGSAVVVLDVNPEGN